MSSFSGNGSAAVAHDRLTHERAQRSARIAGIWFVITFISIAALPLYDSVLNDHRFILGSTGDVSVELGALAEILTAISGIGVAVTLYPILKRQSEGLALGYVTLRVVESALITVGICSVLAVVALRQDLAGGSADQASLILQGRSLVAVHDATFLLGPAFAAAIGNGLMLGYLLFRSGLVPRRYAQFGMAAGALALVAAVLELFGAVDQVSGAGGGLVFPEAVWEFSLGIYLIVRGVRAVPGYFADSAHDRVAADIPAPAVAAQ